MEVCTKLCKHADDGKVHGLQNWFDDVSEGTLAEGKAASRYADGGNVVHMRSGKQGPDLVVHRPSGGTWSIEAKAIVDKVRSGFSSVKRHIEDAFKKFRIQTPGNENAILLDLYKGLDGGVPQSSLEDFIRATMNTPDLNTNGLVRFVDVVYPDGTVRRATYAGGWNDWKRMMCRSDSTPAVASWPVGLTGSPSPRAL